MIDKTPKLTLAERHLLQVWEQMLAVAANWQNYPPSIRADYLRIANALGELLIALNII